MWAIISTSSQLKFYSFDKKEFFNHHGLDFNIMYGQSTGEVNDHNYVVKQLLAMGYPVFLNKKDAKEKVLAENLTGFKYLQLKPTVLN